MRFWLGFLLIGGAIAVSPLVVLAWMLLPSWPSIFFSLRAVACTGNKAITEQSSEDGAYKAILYLDHCPGAYTPSINTYFIRLVSRPDSGSSPAAAYSGSTLDVNFADDGFDDGPVSLAWPHHRDLAVVVQNAKIAGTITRRAMDVVVTMTYQPTTAAASRP